MRCASSATWSPPDPSVPEAWQGLIPVGGGEPLAELLRGAVEIGIDGAPFLACSHRAGYHLTMSKSNRLNVKPLGTHPTVVLFDVDGTLIRTEGRSRHSRAFHAAFLQVYGIECHFTSNMHGMTDLQIYMALARELAHADGRARTLAEEACRRMVEIYQTPDETDGHYVALPGAPEALEILSRRSVLLGLVTGNAPEIAQDKLSAVQLDRFFSFGAYGTEGEVRSALPPIAVVRAEAAAGRPVDRNRVFIVGDTPRDVACALDNGCRAVAVATGSFTVEQLKVVGAELVLPNLLEIEPLLRLMEESGDDSECPTS